MADVGFDGRGDRSRAQLILVGGLVVTLSLVALVLLLNTTMFAQNLSTRGIDPGADRADDHRAFTEHAGRMILAAENAPVAGHETWSAVEANVTVDLEAIATVGTNATFRRSGAFATLSIEQTREGQVIIQNETGNFTSANNSSTWTLANTNGIRSFTMTVENVSATADPFSVNVSESLGGTWGATVNGTEDGTIRVRTSTGETCTSAAPSAIINWTGGTMGSCSFGFAVDDTDDNLTGTLDLEYQNGDRINGTYSLVVSAEEAQGSILDFLFDDPTDEGPWSYPAAYSVILGTTYREGETHYETDVRVAPDEPPQTSPV